MSAPVRLRDDESVPPDRRELLRNASGSRAMPKEVRARSAARLDRLLIVPAAAGLLLWMKSVAAAGLCVLGVVGVVRVVPTLTRWVAPSPAPSASSSTQSGRPPDAAERNPPIQMAGAPSEAPLLPSPAGTELPDHPGPVPAPVRGRAPAAPSETSRKEPSPSDPLAREAAMLEQARAALNRNPGAALAIADRHAATFPDGSLGMERELLAVQALQRLGRVAEARSRGLRLLEQARGSIYEQRVNALLDALPSR